MRTKIALIAAIILGLFAAIGVRKILTQNAQEYEQKGRKVTILLARETLNVGDVLNAANVKEDEMEARHFTDNYILASELKQFDGQKVNRKVPANMPLQKTFFVKADTEWTFAPQRIDPGKRAVTLGADQISGVAGLIIPGSRVDIVGTFRTRSRGPEIGDNIETKFVARNVMVLAIDNRMDIRIPVRGGRQSEGDRGYSSITLLVTPFEAAILIYAQSVGKLTFLLRNPRDDQAIGKVEFITPSTFDQEVFEAGRIRDLKMDVRQPSPAEKPPAPAPN